MMQQRSIQDSSDGELLIVTVDKDGIEELENEEGEIVIDGMLYDIEKSISAGNSIELHLQKDEGETEWKDHYSKLNNLLHKQSNPKAATAAKAQSIFVALFYTKQTAKDFPLYKEKLLKHYAFTENNYTAPYPGMKSPPPKNA